MAKLTERISFTLSADHKKQLRAWPEVLNIWVSEPVRRIVNDAISWDVFQLFCAEHEPRASKATVQ